jgi:hypothetical protein
MNLAQMYCLTGAAIFFLTGLLTGIWKYYRIVTSEKAVAPVYVDTVHRASLMYAFAAILLHVFAGYSVYSDAVNAWAALAALAFFALAIGTYLVHGFLNDTDNQFLRPYKVGIIKLPPFLIHGFMLLLIIAEVGGSGILVWGSMLRVWN